MDNIIESIEGYGKFKFELTGIASRTVVIPEHITLVEVHELPRALFGWEHCHLWEFHDSAGRKFEYKSDDGWKPINDERLISPDDVCLSDVLPSRGGKLHYTYDFGDDWTHVITRMAAPKSPGCYCVKTEGPDGIEDAGGARGLGECKSEWHVPDVAEITKRLECIDFHPRKSGTGLIEKESKALDDVVKSLSEYEWNGLENLETMALPVCAEAANDFKNLSVFCRASGVSTWLQRFGAATHTMQSQRFGAIGEKCATHGGKCAALENPPARRRRFYLGARFQRIFRIRYTTLPAPQPVSMELSAKKTCAICSKSGERMQAG